MTESVKSDDRAPVRLDKWLWAARFFRTRGLAAEATAGGLVHLSGARVKPAKLVHVGDELAIRRGPDEVIVIVRGLAERRGPAAQAARLYEETEASRRRREETAARRAERPRPGGRPTKKARRDLRKSRWE